MSNEESISDVVKEARELLARGALLLPLRVEGWHKSLTDGGWFIRHSTGRTLATVEFVPVEIETGRPALDGNAPARAVVALLNAVPALCDEVEQLRSLNQTQAASIETFQSQQRVMKEAIEQALLHLQGCGYKTNRQVQEQLITAITPKGSPELAQRKGEKS